MKPICHSRSDPVNSNSIDLFSVRTSRANHPIINRFWWIYRFQSPTSSTETSATAHFQSRAARRPETSTRKHLLIVKLISTRVQCVAGNFLPKCQLLSNENTLKGIFPKRTQRVTVFASSVQWNTQLALVFMMCPRSALLIWFQCQLDQCLSSFFLSSMKFFAFVKI